MKTIFFIALLFFVTGISAHLNYILRSISPEIREKQLTNDQKYSTAYEIMAHGEKTANTKLLTQARTQFEEILSEAKKDPQAVSERTLFATQYRLGLLYYNIGVVAQGSIFLHNLNKAKELLLAVTQAPLQTAISPFIYVHSCYLVANIYWFSHDEYRAERFFRKVIAYAIQHQEFKKDDAIRPIAFSARIALTKLLSYQDNFLKEALSMYQALYYELKKNPVTDQHKAAYIENELNALKLTLLKKMRELMPGQEESPEWYGRPEWRI